jgi:hypothetical protein
MDKRCRPWALGSGDHRSLAQKDVAAGVHAHLTTYTQVLNPSCHRLTQQQEQEYMSKCYDDSAMG